MNQITVNVIKPEDPVVPDTGGDDSAVTPNTGTITTDNYNGGAVTPVIGGIVAILLITIFAIVVAAIYRNRMKKVEKSSSDKSNRHFLTMTTGLILLLTAFTVFGFLKSNDSHFSAHADGGTNNSNTISISTNDVDINVELTDEPVYAMATSTVTVNSATEAGYTLSAYVENADLVSEVSADQVSSLTPSTSTTKLADNTWGVALTSPADQESEVFVGLPTDISNPMTIKETTEATTAGDTTNLYFATYVTPDLDYGTYTGATIHYIAVANPSVLYLQNVTEWGNDLEVDTPVEAVDKRDSKVYTVSKMRDGRIWMMQNLDLDLKANVIYTSEDTDLPANATWQPANSTVTSGDDWVHSDTAPTSYDPDDYYWNGNLSDWSDWDAYFYDCTWDSVTKKFNCDESKNPFANYISNTGIPQYHLGNYYNFAATNATNDASVYSESETSSNHSICPANWTLPGRNDFFDMWGEYGYTTTSKSGDDAMWLSPLLLPITGYFDGGVLTYLGSDGSFWASEVKDADNGWGVDYAVDGYLDTVWGHRYYGHSVRCVAR
jgi:hypothetical protein